MKMAKPEVAFQTSTEEKVIPIVDSGDSSQVGESSNPKRHPFVLERKPGGGRGNMALMLGAAGIVLIFGIVMIALLSTKEAAKHKTAAEAAKPNLGRYGSPAPSEDLVPEDRMKPSPAETKTGNIKPSDIEHTKSLKPAQSQAATQPAAQPGAKTLNQIAKFQEPDTTPGSQKWAPSPYGSNPASDQQALKRGEEALSKPSLVFAAHERNVAEKEAGTTGQPEVTNLGLAPGYHVAARLEAMATTAIHAPVVAVIEHNYERDGEIIIPAGSRAVGKITQADPSGLMNLTFSSIEFPSGETVPIEAVGANISLDAIKGNVTGKQTGKSLMVRSLAGIGETAAMMVGAPNGNSAFSENDMLRMRMADNIGNASDEQIMRLLTLQHIVVSVPAGTEIYLVFIKSQSVPPSPSHEGPSPVDTAAVASPQ